MILHCHPTHRASNSIHCKAPYFLNQHGFTLIELLVALALSTLIAAAAISALIVARQGFTAVDAASQLRDNGRFSSDLIQRLVVQAGFEDVNFSAATRANEFKVIGITVNPEPHVLGLDNSLVSSKTDLPSVTGAGFSLRPSACSSTTDTACANGSDVLILRYQTSEGIMGTNTADGSMINCAGQDRTTAPTDKDDRMISIFHVAKSTTGEEPSLMCSYQSSTGTWQTQPIVEGVESFQVLYGVDGFTSLNTQFNGATDTVPDKYLRASQMVVGAANSEPTYSNWRRVRSLRIGLVLRGARNSAVSRTTNINKLCALGVNPDIAADCVDQSGAEAPPMGSEFPRAGSTIADDGRLRQTLTFTVFLRNVQKQ